MMKQNMNVMQGHPNPLECWQLSVSFVSAIVLKIKLQYKDINDNYFCLAEEEARFTKNLSNVEGTETDSIKMICEVSKPSAEVTWYKGDQEIPEGGRYEHVADGRKRILIIQDLRMDDAGEYQCKLPASETKGTLKISGKF